MLVGLLGAFALLLGAAGLAKLFAPEVTARALGATRLPATQAFSSKFIVRLFGVAEMGVALLVVIVGGRVPAVLLALSYALLAVMAWRLVRYAPGQDCGCFGRSAEPATKWHVGVNSSAMMLGLVASIWPQQPLVGAAIGLGAAGVVLSVGVVLLCWLVYLMMTALPELLTLNAKVASTR